MRYLSNVLKLVYPPISNQEAEWLSRDDDVRKIVKASNIYMIGQRQQLYFENFNVHSKLNGLISFNLKMGSLSSPTIYYSIYNELSSFNNEDDEIHIELGPKLIRITMNGPQNVINWFTPDSFLFRLSRKEIQVTIHEEFDFRKFSKFELHYVGISKKEDSFSRLYDQGHKGRLRILTNAVQMEPTARLSDELCIFFFDIEHYNINVFSDLTNIENDLFYHSDKIRVISDAEKAFVKILETEYNKEKYQNYPRGKDGLYNENLIRYTFGIQEDLLFYTNKKNGISLQGQYDILKEHDVILIEGDTLEIIKSQDNIDNTQTALRDKLFK